MEFILAVDKKEFSFTSLFDGEKPTIVKIMATFLAMLELTRLKRLVLRQDAVFGEIYCTKLEEPQRKEIVVDEENKEAEKSSSADESLKSEFD
jgi:segregation and condensation protein A